MYHLIDTPSWHPLLPLIWNGTCDAGQLTAAGLADSVQHGTDFFSVYGPQGKVPFLHDGVNEKDVYIRTSNSDRTYQVAGGLLHGMGHHGAFPVHTQPSNIVRTSSRRDIAESFGLSCWLRLIDAIGHTMRF